MKNAIIFISILLSVLFFFSSCSYKSQNDQKTLLVYCGITMIKPMAEIKEIIEKRENCHIEITKGGSGNLLKALEQSKVGDLYLPGGESYIEVAYRKGLIADTATVGHNKLVLLVQKGNPLNIKADIESLINKDYYVIIGNPNSGSVGKSTKKFLKEIGIFEEVEENAIRFTTDSKDLSVALINKEADLVVNWYATYTWGNNKDHMEILNIPDLDQTKNKLILSRLTTSKHPEISKKILDYAISPEGQAIFEKHGLK